MSTNDHFYILLNRYTADQCSAEEEEILFRLIDSGNYTDVLSSHIEANLASDSLNSSKISAIRAEEIMERILQSETQTVNLIVKNKSWISISRWAVAAAVTAIVFFGAYFYQKNSASAFSVKDIVSLQNDPQETVNETGRPLTVSLEDGSKIVLQAGAKINYPKHFLAEKREVYLDGEAFFQVSKNPGRPFFVYHNNLVTQVLGTSFNIIVDQSTDMIEVDVISGRVQVSEWVAMHQPSVAGERSGVILTPNQKAVYNKDRRQFVTSLVDIPLPVAIEDTLSTVDKQVHLVYENAKLAEVLSVIESMYKIEIVLENDNLLNCLFTGDLSDPNLFVNLDVLTSTINAVSEVKGTKILLKGKGCIQ